MHPFSPTNYLVAFVNHNVQTIALSQLSVTLMLVEGALLVALIV
jgi:hypothetical protein